MLVLEDYEVNGYKSYADIERRFEQHILPFFGESTRAITIGQAHIEAFKAHRKRQKYRGHPTTNGEINRELESLRRAFNLGYEQELVIRRPKFTMLPELKKRTTYWTDDEFATLLENWPSAWTRPLLQFMNLTGWRVSECQRLTWSDNVDLQAGHLILREGKTKSGEPRIFPFRFMAELEGLLKSQQKAQKGPWVFHRDGREIRAFNKEWYAALKKLPQFKGKKRHDFRSTAARRLVSEYRIPADIVRRMVGWESIMMLEYYNVVEAADIHDAVNYSQHKTHDKGHDAASKSNRTKSVEGK